MAEDAADAVDAILEQWRRERPDLDTTPMGVIGRISRLARHFDRAIAENFAPFELGPDEFDLLATLRRSGKPYELKPSELLASMMVSSATTTHRLDKLETRKLIERKPDPTDRRAVLVRLTPAGKKLVDRALAAHVALEHRLLAGLDERQRSALAQLLRRLNEEVVPAG
ncbi:MAG TPA: MarR family transcriptional regulator [Acidimicrobiales bacterium]|nr:MarR family transcriptional regulator [Acidimicrobiales bacterium]